MCIFSQADDEDKEKNWNKTDKIEWVSREMYVYPSVYLPIDWLDRGNLLWWQRNQYKINLWFVSDWVKMCGLLYYPDYGAPGTGKAGPPWLGTCNWNKGERDTCRVLTFLFLWDNDHEAHDERDVIWFWFVKIEEKHSTCCSGNQRHVF